jgi:hypothetical protein
MHAESFGKLLTWSQFQSHVTGDKALADDMGCGAGKLFKTLFSSLSSFSLFSLFFQHGSSLLSP